jgi:hypothetical protein
VELRRSLGVIVVALAVVGALGAGAWAAPAKTKPKPAAKHKRAAKKPRCTLGQDVTKHTCLPNPAYAKTACAAWTPAAETFLGGPAQLSPAGNGGAQFSEIGCAWRAADDLAKVQAGTPLGEVPLTLSYTVWSSGAGTAAEFKRDFAKIQQSAAMPVAEIQKQYDSMHPDTAANPCVVRTQPWGSPDRVVSFDQPRLLPGLGDLAYSWDVCSGSLASFPTCDSAPKSKAGPPAVECYYVWWNSEVDVLKGNVAYHIHIKRPEMSISDDQLVAFVKTLMAKYH